MESENHQARTGMLLIVAIVASCAYIGGKFVETRDRSYPTITVQGVGKISATPDIAMLNFGVQTGRQQSAQGAMENLTRKMNAIIAAVKETGVEDKDISTQGLWMNPSYDYIEGRRIETGFEASQNLQVKVRDLTAISKVLDAAVREGANQVGGVSFTIDDMESLREQAREQAITDGKEKAAKLAGDLDMSLGKFLGYGDGGNYSPPMPYARTMAVSEDAAMGGGMMAPDVPAGSQEINVNVSLTYRVR